jgi:acetolactate synthase-1/3 small subunit
LVEDTPRVLNRVAGLFSRRGFNINSITVGESEDKGYSRIVIDVDGDDKVLEQVQKQLYKLIDVIKVVDMTNEARVDRELVLFKVNAHQGNKNEIQHIVDTFRGKIVDFSLNSLIIEVTGDCEKIEAIKDLLDHHGILEMVRTGKISMVRAKNN